MKFQTKIYYELAYIRNWRMADIVKEIKKKSKVWDVKSLIRALGMRFEIKGEMEKTRDG